MAELAELAATEHLLVALDFDGTLSPLVDEPMTARMIPAAHAALTQLAALPELVSDAVKAMAASIAAAAAASAAAGAASAG